MDSQLSKKTTKIAFAISFILLAIGNCGGPLIVRLYFIHGGSRLWLSTWLQTAGCPILLLPLAISYFNRCKTEGPNTRLILMRFPAFVFIATIGVGVGLANFMYAEGIQRLPVSTSTILLATTLVFTAVFAFFIVKQKFTAYTINAIVLLSVGAVLLALRANNDRPEGETKRMYILGIVFTLAASALNGLFFPVSELVYRKTKEATTFTFIMEMQFVLAFFSTVFATVAMLINKDFQAISHEAREFKLGETKYYLILVFGVIVWQCSLVGLYGILFSTSALLANISVSALLPVSEALAVIIFHEKFQAEKGVCLVLSLWGFASHFYGEYKQEKKNQARETEVNTVSQSSTVAPNLASLDVQLTCT